MIRYKLFQDNRQTSENKGKWYARAVAEETVDTEKLAEHMASHNLPYSQGVIAGVLKDAIVCIKELVLDGKNVKLDNLAIFSAGLRTKAADTIEAFNVTENILSVRLRARATGTFRGSVLTREATKKQFTEYAPTPKSDTPQA